MAELFKSHTFRIQNYCFGVALLQVQCGENPLASEEPPLNNKHRNAFALHAEHFPQCNLHLVLENNETEPLGTPFLHLCW